MSAVTDKAVFRLLIKDMRKQMNLTNVLILGVVLNRRSVGFIKGDK